jgi:hypothetical protein
MFQSLGWNHPKFNHWRKNFAVAFAVLITLGNISMPIAVLTKRIAIADGRYLEAHKAPAAPASHVIGQ